MNETDYNARLYEKMKAEQDKYRDWLLNQEPSEKGKGFASFPLSSE